MSEMFELLKEGLEGILQHQKGSKKLKKRVVEVPVPAIQYKADDVKRIGVRTYIFSLRWFMIQIEK